MWRNAKHYAKVKGDGAASASPRGDIKYTLGYRLIGRGSYRKNVLERGVFYVVCKRFG